MDRRSILKKLLISTSTLVSLPAWSHNWTREDVILSSSFLTEEHELFISSLVDTILPVGVKGIGGVKVGVDKFLIKLFDRCYETEVQENIIVQINHLDSKAMTKFGNPFTDCDQQQKMDLLNSCATSENESEKSFFELIKSESIKGFTTSREVMVRHYKYRVAPGHYSGCVDVE
ncbi:MAG: gluconate 2-dehydrogenase subunit 3 family protein [Saprospiraceae bacterium]|nr:gluconate 2-dehydrogenase subunit 3 family protein [Saprospiraceae bacterium]